MGAAGGGIDRQALAATPKEVLGWRIWLIVIWASYSGSLHGFNTANISGIMSMESFIRDYRFDQMSDADVTNWQGWAVSSMLLGQLAGVMASGPVNEKFGRKASMLVAALFYTVGSVLMAANLQCTMSQLIAGRVLSGLGSGFGMTTGAIYIAETAPSAVRGTMSTFYNVGIMSGVTGAYWINYGSLLHIPDESSWQWRVPMILQLIPSVAIFAGWPFCPESPRFLALSGSGDAGRLERARQVLLGLRRIPEDHEYFQREWAELRLLVGSAAEGDDSNRGWKAFKTLFEFCLHDSSTRKRFVLVIIIQTFFIMSGGNSITYYAPTILSTVGLDSEDELLFTGIYGIVKVVTVVVYAFFMTDRFGRRPLLLIGTAINLCALVYLAAYLGVAEAGFESEAAAWVAIVFICIFAVGYGIGWAPVFSLTTSEICPTQTRGTIVTVAFTYQNLLNFGITRGFPNMTATMGAAGPFALFAGFMVVALVWIYLAFPECKGRSMETMDQLFQLPWWRVGWAQQRNGGGDTMDALEASKIEDADKKDLEVAEKEHS